jgi:hypothetical protein
MLKIKLFAVFAFLAFASCAFLFSGSRSQAQSSKNAKMPDDVLEKVADYKLWKQVQKTEKSSDEVLTISDSAPEG